MEVNKKLESVVELGKLDEEFENFMHKVNEVNSIVKKLASKDKHVQEIGDQEARNYLGDDKEIVLENIEDENVVLKVSKSRTLVNKKALLENESKNPNEMSQEKFMEEMSKDADKRYKDRLIRTEKMETFKKQANLAFRRGEFEKALTLYNKAIEQIKDSTLLYNNRALTYIKLGLYDKAKDDLKNWALRINEDCLKSWLLLAKIHFLTSNIEEFEKCAQEAEERNPGQKGFIEGYIQELKLEGK